jgi:hypothetical protein
MMLRHFDERAYDAWLENQEWEEFANAEEYQEPDYDLVYDEARIEAWVQEAESGSPE